MAGRPVELGLQPGDRVSICAPNCVEWVLVQLATARLRRLWSGGTGDDGLRALLSPQDLEALDPFDRVQLMHVIAACRGSRTLSDARRTLFAASRARRSSSNDADRLRKYLARFGLSWAELTWS